MITLQRCLPLKKYIYFVELILYTYQRNQHLTQSSTLFAVSLSLHIDYFSNDIEIVNFYSNLTETLISVKLEGWQLNYLWLTKGVGEGGCLKISLA